MSNHMSMKSVLWFILVVIAIIILFVLVGLLSPGQRGEDEVTVDAPREFVWEQYLDKELMHKWMPGLQEIELVSGADGEIGAEYQIKLSSINEEGSIMNQKITNIEEYESYAFDFDSEHLTGHTNIEFEAAADTATIIKVLNQYKGKVFWTNSLLQLFRQNIDKNSKEQYDGLKTLIEKNYQKQLQSMPQKSAADIINPKVTADELNQK